MTQVRRVALEVGGIRLCAHVEGEGAPLLVLHGFTGDAASMHSVSEAFVSEMQVIRLELVGHGESDAPQDLAFYSMQACVEQIAGVVAALELNQAPHLLGYSMGGRAALSAAVAYPSLFSSLVLVGATAGISDPAARAERIVADEALAERIERDGLAAFVDRWMALPIFASQSRLGQTYLDAARAQRMRNRPHGLAQSLRGMGAGAQPPIFDSVSHVEKPALFVVGGEDEKFQNIARQLEAGMSHAEVSVLAGVGHAAHLEAPEEFARIVRAFWGRHSSLTTGPTSGPTSGPVSGPEENHS